MNLSNPPRLEETGGKMNIYYKNKYLYSSNNLIKRIHAKIDSLEITEGTLIIVPSPLLFHGIDHLESKLKKNCSILFIEYEECLYSLNKNKLSLFTFIKAYNTGEAESFLENFDFSSFRKIILLPLNNGYFINRNYYNSFHEIFQKKLNTYWKNKITMISLSSRWFSNIFSNLPLLLNGRDVSSLKVKGPVVVAGAGESLEKSLPVLKKYRHRFTLIVIDTAASTLFNADIKPDFILAVESQFYNIFDFYNLKNSGIPLICDLTSYPQTGRITGGENYFFMSEFAKSPFIDFMDSKGLLPLKIPPMGSVGVIAVYLASLLTDTEIIYAGLDFSFIPGKSHSKNSPFITLTSLLSSRLSSINNYSFCLRGESSKTTSVNGKIVYTNSNLRSYSDNLKDILLRRSGIYSLFPSGITENKNNISDEESFYKLLTLTDKTAQPCIETGINIKKIGPLLLKDFYLSEINKINDIIRYSVDYLNGKSNEERELNIKVNLKKCSYITADFPEINAEEKITPPYIKRVLLSCYKYERVIKNSLSRI